MKSKLTSLIVIVLLMSLLIASCAPAATEVPMAEETEAPMAEETEAPKPLRRNSLSLALRFP
jgi:hypothetical protein